jgi:hypothetical protein
MPSWVPGIAYHGLDIAAEAELIARQSPLVDCREPERRIELLTYAL